MLFKQATKKCENIEMSRVEMEVSAPQTLNGSILLPEQDIF